MKRTRGVVKKYIEDSDSEDEKPLKKSPQTTEGSKKTEKVDGSSSSESDIENYLEKPEKLDLDSEFFNTKKEKTPEFEKIERSIFAGVTRLSDSESEDEEKVNVKNEKIEKPKTPVKVKTVKVKTEGEKASKMTFEQLQDYTKKIEEAKKFVEIYKAKKQAEENKTDILNLLAAGERKTGMEDKITVADLHSSDFESCDSEQEDWEEIKTKSTQEPQEKSIVPEKSLQITVNMPDNVKKKKGVDLLAAMKRRLNRIRKENQVLVHKVHLLCWIAHGNYVNSAVNNTQTLAMALSLLPSEQCYPADRTDLAYLEQIVGWYKRTVKIMEKPVPDNMPLDKCLQLQINRKEVHNKKMLAVIFAAILRALGIQCRIVMSFQVEPLRPPASELHSLSTKDVKKVTKSELKEKIKSQTAPLSKSLNVIPSTSNSSKNENDKNIKKSTHSEKQKSNKSEKSENKNTKEKLVDKEKNSNSKLSKNKELIVKITPSTPKNEKTKQKEETKEEKGSSQSKSKKESDKGAKSLKSVKNKSSLEGESKNLPKRNSRSESNKRKSASRNTQSQDEYSNRLQVVKPRKRTKSTDSESSSQSNTNLKLATAKTQKHTESAKNKELQTEVSSKTKSALSKTRKRTISTGSKDAELSQSSASSNLGVPRTRKRTKSTESKDSELSVKSNNSRKRSKSAASTPNSKKSGKGTGDLEASSSTKTRNKRSKRKTITQVDGVFDTDSNTSSDEKIIIQVDGVSDELVKSKTKSKPNLKVLKKTSASSSSKTKPVKQVEDSDSGSDFEPPGRSLVNRKSLGSQKPNLNKLKGGSRLSLPGKQVDVRNDIINLIKGRISEQKSIDRNKIVKKPMKRKVESENDDSDSDYVPEPIKKKQHDSDDDFVPKVKVKRRVQIPGKSVLSESESDSPTKKKRQGNDVWVEVFLEAEEKWISVDLVYGQVHCVKEIYNRATHPVTYVVAWDNNNNLKDVTQRYCTSFNTVTRKLRVDAKWWNEAIKSFMGPQTARDKEEDDDLARQQLDQPLPKAISEYKNHPLYALRRHLLKFEAIYPPEPPTLGFIRGEAVYPRSCIYTLHSRDIWLKQAKVVKLGEQPYKIVKARPKYDRLSNKMITDQTLEIFGPWQVQDYEPPTAENGIVPKNAFGNVDLFKPCMLPKGTVHLKLPGLNKLARKMNIDCASAIVGFDFHGGWSHPVYDGFVVCKEYEDQLICAWELEQDELEKKEQEKIDKRVYGNWKKLIKGLLIRERLKAKYDFGEPSSSGTSSKEKKKKAPTFCTKKK